ncbi:MAG: hypothetical protein JWN71_1321 [Xanthobacteraceae bacterium]|nr:hypothetical protein [Xanthobacteraceae bacterium]
MSALSMRGALFGAACLTATPALAQSPDQWRAICKDPVVQQKMLAQTQGNQRAALEIELEARCAFVGKPATPVHDTADTSPAGSHVGWVRDARYSADGRTIVSGGRDGKARLWDAGTGMPIREMTGADDYQVEGVIRGGEAYAVTNLVRLLDAATGNVLSVRPVAPRHAAGMPGVIAATSKGLLLVGGHKADVEAIDI